MRVGVCTTVNTVAKPRADRPLWISRAFSGSVLFSRPSLSLPRRGAPRYLYIYKKCSRARERILFYISFSHHGMVSRESWGRNNPLARARRVPARVFRFWRERQRRRIRWHAENVRRNGRREPERESMMVREKTNGRERKRKRERTPRPLCSSSGPPAPRTCFDRDHPRDAVDYCTARCSGEKIPVPSRHLPRCARGLALSARRRVGATVRAAPPPN